MDSIKSIDTRQSPCIDDRCQSRIGSRSPTGSKTANHLPMNDGWTQSPFANIVGWTDICTMKANKKTVSILMIATLQLTGFWLSYGPLDQPITQPFDSSNLGKELIHS